MALGRYEQAAATTAPVSSGIADAAQPGSAVSDDRALLRWPCRSREQQERARKAAEEAEKSETSPESSDASDDEENNSEDGRDNDQDVDAAARESTPSSPVPAQDGQPSDRGPVLGDEMKQ